MDSFLETAKKTFADLFNGTAEKTEPLEPDLRQRERESRDREGALLATERRADPARRSETEQDDNPRPSALNRAAAERDPLPPENIFASMTRPVPKPQEKDDDAKLAPKPDGILKNSFAMTAQIVKKVVEIMQGGTQQKTSAPKTARFKKDA